MKFEELNAHQKPQMARNRLHYDKDPLATWEIGWKRSHIKREQGHCRYKHLPVVLKSLALSTHVIRIR